jgi:hypothetical protein
MVLDPATAKCGQTGRMLKPIGVRLDGQWSWPEREKKKEKKIIWGTRDASYCDATHIERRDNDQGLG